VGPKGIWIRETTFFNGPEKLPDDIAAEMRDLYLARKSDSEMSERFRLWAETENRHNSRWNFHNDGAWEHGRYIPKDKGHGIFGHTSHIMGDAARIAAIFWDRCLDTLDATWLRDRAYSMIKGAAEFYRNFPNFKKGADGEYHIEHVNNGESNWDTPDTRSEIGNIRMIMPIAIRAAQILNVDRDLQAEWADMEQRKLPLPAIRPVAILRWCSCQSRLRKRARLGSSQWVPSCCAGALVNRDCASGLGWDRPSGCRRAIPSNRPRAYRRKFPNPSRSGPVLREVPSRGPRAFLPGQERSQESHSVATLWRSGRAAPSPRPRGE
jgi:hypothetical protein